MRRAIRQKKLRPGSNVAADIVKNPKDVRIGALDALFANCGCSDDMRIGKFPRIFDQGVQMCAVSDGNITEMQAGIEFGINNIKPARRGIRPSIGFNLRIRGK